jgi:hypothetical protein
VPNEISGEDLNGLRLLDKALDEALVQLVWRYRALVGIREVELGPERPLTEGERHTRQWLDPVTFEDGRQRFPQFLNQSQGQLAASEKEAVCFMMAMSDADEFVCGYIVAREFPGGRTLRDLCDLWLDAIGAMEPVYKENPTVREQRLPTAGIGVGDQPAAANPVDDASDEKCVSGTSHQSGSPHQQVQGGPSSQNQCEGDPNAISR